MWSGTRGDGESLTDVGVAFGRHGTPLVVVLERARREWWWCAVAKGYWRHIVDVLEAELPGRDALAFIAC